MDVTAKVRRSGVWWAVEVPEVPGVFTQAKRLDQVAETVSDAVALMVEVDPADVQVTVDVDLEDELRARLTALADVNERAKALSKEASLRSRELVDTLRARDLSVRDVGVILDVSPQRVSQLASSKEHANPGTGAFERPRGRLRGAVASRSAFRVEREYRGQPRREEVMKVAKGDIETYYENGEWKNKVQGSRRAANTGGTKAERQAVGRRMAQERHVEHVIKKQDGTIGEKNSYGNDPPESKG